MIIENLSTLKINKLSEAQYERELAAGRIDENALYLTPDEGVDFSQFASASDVEALQAKVGDKSVSEQITSAIENYNSDWNAKEGEPGHVLNRTHWIETKFEVLIPETSVEISNVGQPAFSPFILEIQEGSTYEVTWNGNVYQCVAYILEGAPVTSIGNATIVSFTGGNDEPFFITYTPGETLVFAKEAGTHTVSISGETVTWHTLDRRYLPANLLTTDDVNNKMDATDPVGTGSFSMNRKPNTTIGELSHTEGYYSVASGEASHAEGSNTYASGEASHAEGSGAHATGLFSHAEGDYSVASGARSHAEGRGTIAAGENQHAQGKFNIEDTENKYAHIVGNGTSVNASSNAYTLDWDGNAWFAGTVEGTSVIIPSSTEGSTKRFKLTVDDSGNITATELT